MLIKYKIVVAHPDDEILFFNSVLERAERTIICFGPSASRVVSEGRGALRCEFLLQNVRFLWLKEADVHSPETFCRQRIVREGLTVSRNVTRYRENFDAITSHLEAELVEDDTVFTHNPWGEYGHEEHVQVFNAVLGLQKKLRLKIFVSSYISDRSWGLMKLRKDMLAADALLGHPNEFLGQQYLALYVKHQCWTWDNDYAWPRTELFFPINPHAGGEKTSSDVVTAYPPFNVLSKSYKQSRTDLILSQLRRRQRKARAMLGRMLPEVLKSFLRKR